MSVYRAHELLRRYGRDPTSFQILEEGIERWIDGEALIGYAVAGGMALTVGPPVCPRGQEAEALRRFEAAIGRPVALFGVEPKLMEALEARGAPFDTIKIGERPDWRPADYHTQGPQRRSLRAQINRARNKGLTARPLPLPELRARRAELETLTTRWLASRRMSVMRFMVDLEPFSRPEARRYYIAERAGRIEALVVGVPIYAAGGIFFEDVIRDPAATNGAVELLLDHAFRASAAAGDQLATLGLAPLAGMEAELNHPHLRRGVLLAARLRGLYDCEGLRRFKARMRPDAWTPQHLMAFDGRVNLRLLYATLAVFAGGAPLRFGLETIGRRLSPSEGRL